MRLITGSLRVVRFKKLRDWPTLIINVLSCKKNALIKSKTGPHFLSKGVGCLLASLQGVPLEKKLERNDCSSDTVHILPQVGKAETNLKGGRVFFHFSRICLHFSKYLLHLKRILGLLTWGQICLSFWFFQMEHPVE